MTSNPEKFSPRRTDRALSREEAEAVLREAEFGTIAVCDGDEPYGVPVSFVYFQNAIWIHGATAGRKFRLFSAEPTVHFSVVSRAQAVFTHFFTTFYASAMVLGKIVPVTNEAEKRDALRELCRKYLPAQMDVADEHISRSFERTSVFKIVPEAISGKAKRPH